MLQGVLVVQTKEPRIFRERRDPHAGRSGRPGRARRQRGPHARSLHRSRAGTSLGAGAQSLVELGPRLRAASSAISIPSAGASSTRIPIALLTEMPLDEIERRATELVLHSRINYAYRRQQEYLQADRTWGATQRRRLRAPPGRLLLGRVRPARVAAHLLRRPRRARRRPHQERLRPRHSRWSASACSTTRATSASARRQRLAAGRLSRDRRQASCPMEPAIGADGEPVHRRDRHPRRLHPRQGLAGEGRPLRPAPARLQRRRQRPRGPRADLAPLRRRRPHPHPPGAAAGRRRLPRAEGAWASRPASCT